ncbi:MAG: histidine kinase, partial [Allobranchiibius sp.]
GLFWAGIWLFFLLSPLLDSLRALDEPKGWVGSVAVLAFAALYLWHWIKRWQTFGSSGGAASPSENRASLLRYAGMGVLALVCVFSVGQSGGNALVFFGISAMWTFPLATAVFTSIAVGLSYVWACFHLSGWHYDSGALLGLTFGTIATFAGRLAGVRSRQLEASRRENARLAVEEERNRMARDLHDILGHSLTVITVKAELAGKLLDADLERARAEIADLERLSRDALADVRRAVTGFREVTLPGELARAREALRAADIRAELPTATDEVASDLREVFAWTIREAVTNVIRHSRARTCTIEITAGSVTVRDDGVGQGDGGVCGNGLLGLRERALAAGTEVVTGGVDPHGFAITMGTPGGSPIQEPAREKATSA